jgi:hypothetical protein
MTRAVGTRYRLAVPQVNALPPFKGSEALAYLRAAWRDPEANGPWAQLIASTTSAGENGRSSTSGTTVPTTTTADTADTTASRAQYVVAAGITRWGLRLSTTNRLRSIGGKSHVSPGARVEYASRLLTVSAFGERAVDSTTRTDVQARLAPFSWVNFGASFSRSAPRTVAIGVPFTASRFEGGLKWHDRWVSGGVVTRGATVLAPPVELDTTLRAVATPQVTGTFAAFHGPLLAGWQLDADFTSWNSAGAYRPQTQTRTRLYFESSFLGRFKPGVFHLLASATHEYRSTTYVPLGTNPVGQSTKGASAISTLLEIRIASAVISWQYRNATGTPYETYPGYLMPRLVSVYGVRWEFWN